MTFTVQLSTSKSQRGNILTLKQLEAADAGLAAEIQFVDAAGQKFVGAFRATKAPYEEPLPAGGKVMILEGVITCGTVLNGKVAIRHYPSGKRTILVAMS